ncbi:MAG: hypothetical protein WA784_14900 [Albidovulum sp.]
MWWTIEVVRQNWTACSVVIWLVSCRLLVSFYVEERIDGQSLVEGCVGRPEL